MGAKIRWTVMEADAIERVVEQADPQGGGAALAAGRVFASGARMSAGAEVAAGAIVEIWSERDEAGVPLTILRWERDVLAVDKPAGLATVPDHRGTESLASQVAAAIAARGGPPRAAHPMSRLDVGVSGVVVFALAKDARRASLRAAESGDFEKSYVAVAKGSIAGAGTVERPIEGRPATTRYAVCARAGDAALVDLVPVTGRTHQLRTHLAALGAPIFGDRANGGPTRLTSSTGAVTGIDRVMLHAARVRLARPDGSVFEAASPIPEVLRATWIALGGDPADLEVR